MSDTELIQLVDDYTKKLEVINELVGLATKIEAGINERDPQFAHMKKVPALFIEAAPRPKEVGEFLCNEVQRAIMVGHARSKLSEADLRCLGLNVDLSAPLPKRDPVFPAIYPLPHKQEEKKSRWL